MVRPFLFRCDFPFFVVRPSGRMIKNGKYIKKMLLFLLTFHRFGGIIISERGNKNIQEVSTMKYNKSEIMRNAWRIVRQCKCTISTALKRA